MQPVDQRNQREEYQHADENPEPEQAVVLLGLEQGELIIAYLKPGAVGRGKACKGQVFDAALGRFLGGGHTAGQTHGGGHLQHQGVGNLGIVRNLLGHRKGEDNGLAAVLVDREGHGLADIGRRGEHVALRYLHGKACVAAKGGLQILGLSGALVGDSVVDGVGHQLHLHAHVGGRHDKAVVLQRQLGVVCQLNHADRTDRVAGRSRDGQGYGAAIGLGAAAAVCQEDLVLVGRVDRLDGQLGHTFGIQRLNQLQRVALKVFPGTGHTGLGRHGGHREGGGVVLHGKGDGGRDPLKGDGVGNGLQLGGQVDHCIGCGAALPLAGPGVARGNQAVVGLQCRFGLRAVVVNVVSHHIVYAELQRRDDGCHRGGAGRHGKAVANPGQLNGRTGRVGIGDGGNDVAVGVGNHRAHAAHGRSGGHKGAVQIQAGVRGGCAVLARKRGGDEVLVDNDIIREVRGGKADANARGDRGRHGLGSALAVQDVNNGFLLVVRRQRVGIGQRNGQVAGKRLGKGLAVRQNLKAVGVGGGVFVQVGAKADLPVGAVSAAQGQDAVGSRGPGQLREHRLVQLPAQGPAFGLHGQALHALGRAVGQVDVQVKALARNRNGPVALVVGRDRDGGIGRDELVAGLLGVIQHVGDVGHNRRGQNLGLGDGLSAQLAQVPDLRVAAVDQAQLGGGGKLRRQRRQALALEHLKFGNQIPVAVDKRNGIGGLVVHRAQRDVAVNGGNQRAGRIGPAQEGLAVGVGRGVNGHRGVHAVGQVGGQQTVAVGIQIGDLCEARDVDGQAAAEGDGGCGQEALNQVADGVVERDVALHKAQQPLAPVAGVHGDAVHTAGKHAVALVQPGEGALEELLQHRVGNQPVGQLLPLAHGLVVGIQHRNDEAAQALVVGFILGNLFQHRIGNLVGVHGLEHFHDVNVQPRLNEIGNGLHRLGVLVLLQNLRDAVLIQQVLHKRPDLGHLVQLVQQPLHHLVGHGLVGRAGNLFQRRHYIRADAVGQRVAQLLQRGQALGQAVQQVVQILQRLQAVIQPQLVEHALDHGFHLRDVGYITVELFYIGLFELGKNLVQRQLLKQVHQLLAGFVGQRQQLLLEVGGAVQLQQLFVDGGYGCRNGQLHLQAVAVAGDRDVLGQLGADLAEGLQPALQHHLDVDVLGAALAVHRDVLGVQVEGQQRAVGFGQLAQRGNQRGDGLQQLPAVDRQHTGHVAALLLLGNLIAVHRDKVDVLHQGAQHRGDDVFQIFLRIGRGGQTLDQLDRMGQQLVHQHVPVEEPEQLAVAVGRDGVNQLIHPHNVLQHRLAGGNLVKGGLQVNLPEVFREVLPRNVIGQAAVRPQHGFKQLCRVDDGGVLHVVPVDVLQRDLCHAVHRKGIVAVLDVIGQVNALRVGRVQNQVGQRVLVVVLVGQAVHKGAVQRGRDLVGNRVQHLGPDVGRRGAVLDVGLGLGPQHLGQRTLKIGQEEVGVHAAVGVEVIGNIRPGLRGQALGQLAQLLLALEDIGAQVIRAHAFHNLVFHLGNARLGQVGLVVGAHGLDDGVADDFVFLQRVQVGGLGRVNQLPVQQLAHHLLEVHDLLEVGGVPAHQVNQLVIAQLVKAGLQLFLVHIVKGQLQVPVNVQGKQLVGVDVFADVLNRGNKVHQSLAVGRVDQGAEIQHPLDLVNPAQLFNEIGHLLIVRTQQQLHNVVYGNQLAQLVFRDDRAVALDERLEHLHQHVAQTPLALQRFQQFLRVEMQRDRAVRARAVGLRLLPGDKRIPGGSPGGAGAPRCG